MISHGNFNLAKSRPAAARRCVRNNKDADAAAAHPLAAVRLGDQPRSCASIGASSAAGAAGGGAGMLLAGGAGSAALQIAFCQLPRFLMISTGARRRPSRRTGGCCRPRSPALFFLLLSPLALPVVCACVRRGAV